MDLEHILIKFREYNDVTKFLVYTDDIDFLQHMFSSYGSYVTTLQYIAKEDKQSCPCIITVRFNKEQEQLLGLFDDVIQEINSLGVQCYRIFKSITINKKRREKIDGFLWNTANNLLHLLFIDDKTIRIDCENKDIRKKFYDICLKIKEKDSLPVQFDYDDYNITFVLKEFDSDTAKYALVTYIKWSN